MKTLTAPTPAILSTLPTSADHAEQLAVAEYRAANQRGRATRALVMGRNSSASKSLRNVLTGAESPTWCAKWQRTKRVEQWIEEQHRELFGTWGCCA